MSAVRIPLAALATWGLAFASAGCSRDNALPNVRSPSEGRLPEVAGAPPGVPSGLSFLYDLGVRLKPNSAAQAAIPFVSITLNRTGCFGTCPVYRVTLNVDGAAEYKGTKHVPRIGTFVGRVRFYDFAQLALLAERAGFMSLRERYAGDWTDDETTSLTIRARTGQEKTVEDYGSFGPPELWALQRAIDGVVESITWK
jgi:Domain of unknown function (DUF6438)